MNPGRLFQLPPTLATAVLNFLTRPTQDADPQQLAMALPAGWPQPVSEGAQPALLAAWNLDIEQDAALLDPSQTLHRLALLPRIALTLLARQLALQDQAARLRRLVLLSERQALATHIEAAEWVHLRSPKMNRCVEPLASPPLHELPLWLDTVGWALLGSTATLLPSGLAQRLQLKLRPLEAPGLTLPTELAQQRVLTQYAEAAATWSPDWEPNWQHWLAGGV